MENDSQITIHELTLNMKIRTYPPEIIIKGPFLIDNGPDFSKKSVIEFQSRIFLLYDQLIICHV